MNNTFHTFASLQGPLLGLVLITSLLGKIKGRAFGFRDSALAKYMKQRQLSRRQFVLDSIWYGVLGIEVSLVIGAFSRWWVSATSFALVGFFTGAFLYLLWSYSYARGAPCRCFGSSLSVDARTIARSALFVLASVMYALWPGSAWSESSLSWALAVAVLEIIVIVLLSPEAVEFIVDLPLTIQVIPYRSVGLTKKSLKVLRQIEALSYWGTTVVPMTNGTLSLFESWEDGPWRMYTFHGQWMGNAATITAGGNPDLQPPRFRVDVRSSDEELSVWDSIWNARVAGVARKPFGNLPESFKRAGNRRVLR
jgi:hypothetical protein